MRHRAALAVPIALLLGSAPAHAAVECGVEERPGGPALALTTTEFADVAASLPANLLVRGGRGRDDLLAGPLRASANLDGGPGSDVIAGGHESDFVTGGSGPDLIVTVRGGRDDVECGPGRDRIAADRRDRLKGCEKVSR